MAALVNLPNEILQQIFQIDQVSGDGLYDSALTADDLRRVALVARRFVPIAQREIFRSVSVRTTTPHGKRYFDRFLALVRSSPVVASYVESIILSWRSDRWEASVLLDDILVHLTSLRELSMFTDSPERSRTIDFSFLDTNSMLKLRHVRLFGARMTFKSALRLARKPGLIDLRLGRCEGYEAGRDMLETAHVSQSLRSLSTVDSVLLDIELQSLLLCCPQLQQLECNIPRHLQEEESDRPLLWQYRMGVPAIRQHMPDCLTPIATSLRDLTVRTVSEDLREAIAPDLTPLVNLRFLSMEAACLWPKYVNAHFEERKTLASRLPASLEALEIIFEKGKSSEGVFWSADRVDAVARASLLVRSTEPDRYEWVSNLARSKSDHLTQLKLVTLIESYPPHGSDDWYDEGGRDPRMEIVQWQGPPEIERLFRKQRIGLDIRLRMRKETLLIEAPP